MASACRGYPLLMLATGAGVWLLGLLSGGFGFPEFHIEGKTDMLHNVEHESSEQAYLWSHLRPTDVVLSVGGNVGTTCTFIDKVVKDPSRSVCVEPNPDTTKQLQVNKRLHGSHFEVLSAILSRPGDGVVDFTDRGIQAHVSLPGDTVDFSVPTVDRDLSAFSVVVIDCEGCFCGLMQQFPELLKARVIINEVDGDPAYGDKQCDYDFPALLAKHGLARVDGTLPLLRRFFDMSPEHDVFSREPLAGWRRPLHSHLMQLSFTLRAWIGTKTGTRPSLLATEVLLAMALVSFPYIVSVCCPCWRHGGDQKAATDPVRPAEYGKVWQDDPDL